MKGSQLPGEVLIILSDTESCYTEYRCSFTPAYFAKTNQSRAEERHKGTSEQRCTAIKKKKKIKKSPHLSERGGRESVCWPKDAQTPTGLTRHIHLQRGTGAAGTCTLTPLASSAPRQRSTSTSTLRGGKGTESPAGPGGHQGEGAAAPRHSPCAPRSRRGRGAAAAHASGACRQGGEDAAGLRAAAPAQAPAPRRRRKRRARRRHSGRAGPLRGPGTAWGRRHRRSPPRCGRSAGSFPSYGGGARVPRPGGAAGLASPALPVQGRSPFVSRRFPAVPRPPQGARRLPLPTPVRAAPCQSVPGQKVCAVFAEASHLSRAGRDGAEPGEPRRAPLAAPHPAARPS